MKNNSDIDDNKYKTKHPFTIEKTFKEIIKERKNKTLVNPSYENQFKKEFKIKNTYFGDIHQ